MSQPDRTRRLLAIAVACAAPDARAEGAPQKAPAEPPVVTLRAGLVLPVFLIYEVPGPLAGAALAVRARARAEVVARGEVGAVFFRGAERGFGKLGAGVRLTPFLTWTVAPWAQAGVGTATWVERVSVALPERTATSVDHGFLLTADLALGVNVGKRWEAGIGWDHNVLPRPYYRVYAGNEAQPHRGNALAWVGVRL